MLCLGDKVGCDESRIAALAHNGNFSRASEKVDATVKRNLLFGRRNEQVAGANDLVHLRHRFGSIRQSSNGLGAADAVELRDIEKKSRLHGLERRSWLHD